MSKTTQLSLPQFVSSHQCHT
uniref:Uncharacterized protein n=1 Tax=Rhizophora mucronata TaxID=61149 RepID=A0A2P2N738_RHIMU